MTIRPVAFDDSAIRSAERIALYDVKGALIATLKVVERNRTNYGANFLSERVAKPASIQRCELLSATGRILSDTVFGGYKVREGDFISYEWHARIGTILSRARMN